MGQATPPVRAAGRTRYSPSTPLRSGRVAISVELDTLVVQALRGAASWPDVLAELGEVFGRHGFSRRQGTLYIGDEGASEVHCVLAIQDVMREYPWFAASARDVRMLRIDATTDLMPVVIPIRP